MTYYGLQANQQGLRRLLRTVPFILIMRKGDISQIHYEGNESA